LPDPSTPRDDSRVPPAPTRFTPRLTLLLLAGLVLFFASLFVYSLPAMYEQAPPGAVESWHEERVKQRLRGKVHWFLIGSFAAVGALGMRFAKPR
jgi:hypothetical protein